MRFCRSYLMTCAVWQSTWYVECGSTHGNYIGHHIRIGMLIHSLNPVLRVVFLLVCSISHRVHLAPTGNRTDAAPVQTARMANRVSITSRIRSSTTHTRSSQIRSRCRSTRRTSHSSRHSHRRHRHKHDLSNLLKQHLSCRFLQVFLVPHLPSLVLPLLPLSLRLRLRLLPQFRLYVPRVVTPSLVVPLRA